MTQSGNASQSHTGNLTQVVAALIFRGDRLMICQRPEHKPRALLWEFPGGKVEPGETRQQALKRECKEELDVEVEPGKIFMEVTHKYPDMTIHLTLFLSEIKMGEPKLLEHQDICWVTPEETAHYPFCPADEEILNRIRKEWKERG